MDLLFASLNKIIFFFSITGILWTMYRQDRDYTRIAQHKAKVETAALRKYQQLERLFSGTQSSLIECDKKYDALIELGQRVNKDCTNIENSVETLKKRQRILNDNQKVLSNRNELLQKAMAERNKNITIEYIDNSKVKK